jgi:tetratricopeptide (TPR) repeat protein
MSAPVEEHHAPQTFSLVINGHRMQLSINAGESAYTINFVKQWISSALKGNTKLDCLYYHLGRFHQGNGHNEKALTYFHMGIEYSKSIVDLLEKKEIIRSHHFMFDFDRNSMIALGKYHMSQKNYQDAKFYFDCALYETTTCKPLPIISAIAWFEMGEYYKIIGEYIHEMVTCYYHCVSTSDVYYYVTLQSMFELSQYCFNTGNSDSGVDYLKIICENSQCYANTAIIADAKKQYKLITGIQY